MTDDYTGTLVFTEAGTVAHLLPPLISPNSVNEALCGRSPWPSYWHGTGTQDEEERAQTMRVCVQCSAVREHQRNGFLTR